MQAQFIPFWGFREARGHAALKWELTYRKNGR